MNVRLPRSIVGPKRTLLTLLAVGCSPGSDTPAESADARIPDEADALRFLAEVAGAKRTPAPTVGKGAYAVLTGGVVGAELTDESLLAHRNAFTA